MDFYQIAVLAILQGLTEFLPISSSAHLILVPKILEWPDQGLAFDVAVHVGTLMAVIFYFRHQIIDITFDWFRSIQQRRSIGQSQLGWGVIIGTIPAVVAGFMFKDFIESDLRDPLVIATTTVFFGLLLWAADANGRKVRNETTINILDVIIIGLAQAIALIPGTSRSGITITAALFLGFNREGAARFSFLLSIPLILGAGLLKLKDLLELNTAVDWPAIATGALISGVSAYICIYLFLKALNSIGMTPFVIYRLLLGGLLFLLFT